MQGNKLTLGFLLLKLKPTWTIYFSQDFGSP